MLKTRILKPLGTLFLITCCNPLVNLCFFSYHLTICILNNDYRKRESYASLNFSLSHYYDNIMALGRLLYEERGKETSARVIIDAEEPGTEVTGSGNVILNGTDVIAIWTRLVTFGNNGIGYSQGKGRVYLDNKVVASYTTSSVIKPNSPDVASSRGVSSISCSSYDYPKISSLLDGKAAVYELEQDNEGNYSAKFWEWK
jgi:hypothetical protein